MEAFNLISQLEGRLNAHISLSEQSANYWLMRVQLFYDGEAAGTTSFNLEGYTEEEAEAVARNIKNNAFLMREIDEFLWGESD